MEITDYFDKTTSKKRELSEQSNNGEEPKKLREGSSQTESDESSCWDQVFLEGVDSDQRDNTLINYMKRFEAQLKDLHQTSEQTKISQIKGEEHLRELSKFIEFASNRFDEYEKDRKEKDELIRSLRKDVDDMAGIIDNLSLGLDRQEQYSRRNCLLFHNIPETNNESTDELIIKTVADDLNETITNDDIDRSHRLGKPQDGKTRPVIVKFARYYTRNKVFKKKKNLKGKRVSITESLTKRRMAELKEAREKFSFENVWTSDGKILYKDQSDNKIKVYYN